MPSGSWGHANQPPIHKLISPTVLRKPREFCCGHRIGGIGYDLCPWGQRMLCGKVLIAHSDTYIFTKAFSSYWGNGVFLSILAYSVFRCPHVVNALTCALLL